MKTKALIFALLVTVAQPATSQGVPVVDATAIANAKAEFTQTITQMVAELEEAKRLYESVNGITEMGDIVAALNDPKVRELLGPQAMEIAASFDINLDDMGDLADAAKDYIDETRVSVDEVSADDFYRQELDRIGARKARDASVGERIVTSADDRLAGLERLRERIGTASTQKEIDALSARLQVETAMLQNDTNRIQGLAMLQDAQTELQEQRDREVEARQRERFISDGTALYGG